MRSMCDRLLRAAVVCAVFGFGVSACAGAQGRSLGSTSISPASHSFVSLVPACACGNHTSLDEFSTTTGRRIAEIMPIPTSSTATLGTPAAESDGRLLFTYTSGPSCAVQGDYSQCPRLVSDSCVNQVEQWTPGQPELEPLFDVPASVGIGAAVPSPDGSQVAFSQEPCTNGHQPTGLYVRDSATGKRTAVMTRANLCDAFRAPSWNASATKLAFIYTQVPGRSQHHVGGTCRVGTARLAVATLTSHSAGRRIRLISPDRGCAFVSATFDERGSVAAEGCKQGSPPGFADTNLGNAYLVQLNAAGHRIAKLRLKRGLEEALVAREPNSDDVLITQDQPANNGGPEDDWVWEYNGTSLRPVAHYRANDAAQVIAIPW